MPKRRIIKFAVAAVTIASAIGLTASASVVQAATTTAASSTGTAAHAVEHGAKASEAVSPDGAYTNCPSGDYCDFAGTNGSDPCFFAAGSLSTWPPSCINVDESFANRTSGLVRLYYLPDFRGAWVCIDASKYSNDLSGYVFNNGSNDAGYGAPLENDVASSQTGSGSCSNPLPLP